jgi:hypothetical protein
MAIRLQSRMWLVGGLAVFLSAADGLAQGTFQNLDFEQANKVSVGGGLPTFVVYTADALPGWALTVGGAPQPTMFWNVPPMNVPPIPPTTASLFKEPSTRGVLQGLCSVWLKPVAGNPSLFPVLAQTGTIPAGAQSILIDAELHSIPIEMGFAGQDIPLSVVSGSASTFYTYAGDISMFANQTGSLTIWGDTFLDNIRFSDQPIPEPRLLDLSALGALLLGWRGLERRRCQRS